MKVKDRRGHGREAHLARLEDQKAVLERQVAALTERLAQVEAERAALAPPEPPVEFEWPTSIYL